MNLKKFYKKTSSLVQREPAGTAKPKDIVILNAVKNLSGKTDSSPIRLRMTHTAVLLLFLFLSSHLNPVN